MSDIFAKIRCNPLQAANSNRLVFHPAATARRLTGPVTHTPEDARKHIRLSVLDISIAKPPLCDQSDVLRNVGVGRTGPLAIDYLVKVIGLGNISRFHLLAATDSAVAI
jgi:hypothetical protein